MAKRNVQRPVIVHQVYSRTLCRYGSNFCYFAYLLFHCRFYFSLEFLFFEYCFSLCHLRIMLYSTFVFLSWKKYRETHKRRMCIALACKMDFDSFEKVFTVFLCSFFSVVNLDWRTKADSSHIGERWIWFVGSQSWLGKN